MKLLKLLCRPFCNHEWKEGEVLSPREAALYLGDARWLKWSLCLKCHKKIWEEVSPIANHVDG